MALFYLLQWDDSFPREFRCFADAARDAAVLLLSGLLINRRSRIQRINTLRNLGFIEISQKEYPDVWDIYCPLFSGGLHQPVNLNCFYSFFSHRLSDYLQIVFLSMMESSWASSMVDFLTMSWRAVLIWVMKKKMMPMSLVTIKRDGSDLKTLKGLIALPSRRLRHVNTFNVFHSYAVAAVGRS